MLPPLFVPKHVFESFWIVFVFVYYSLLLATCQNQFNIHIMPLSERYLSIVTCTRFYSKRCFKLIVIDAFFKKSINAIMEPLTFLELDDLKIAYVNQKLSKKNETMNFR